MEAMTQKFRTMFFYEQGLRFSSPFENCMPHMGTSKSLVRIEQQAEAESKEKRGVRDPMPELTITSSYVHSNTFTMGNPMPESTLTPSQGLWIWQLLTVQQLGTLG
jgi:hypothetical protein